ncbi:hypothetical protein ACFX2H_038266 [Malus domestica]
MRRPWKRCRGRRSTTTVTEHSHCTACRAQSLHTRCTATEHRHRAQPTDSTSLIPRAPPKTNLLHAAVIVFPLCPKRAPSTSNRRNHHSRALRLQLASPPSPPDRRQ